MGIVVDVEVLGSGSKKRSTATLALRPAFSRAFKSLDVVVNVPKPYDHKMSTFSDERFASFSGRRYELSLTVG